MPLGHPPIYATIEDLQAAIDKYFSECKDEGHCPNVAGMTVSLGYADPQSLIDQCKRGDDFSWIIKRAKRRMWDHKYQFACQGKMNPTIFIFDSINNHGMINTRSENKNDNNNKQVGPIDLAVNFVKPDGD